MKIENIEWMPVWYHQFSLAYSCVPNLATVLVMKGKSLSNMLLSIIKHEVHDDTTVFDFSAFMVEILPSKCTNLLTHSYCWFASPAGSVLTAA